ncbi:Uncharacterised protein [Chlamydia trachomatis]|nr:Uncharacterised protein [Chlamydia trachomatis]
MVLLGFAFCDDHRGIPTSSVDDYSHQGTGSDHSGNKPLQHQPME